jgi:hypothetical protein
MAVTLKVKNLDSLRDKFKMGLGARPTVRMGIILQGPAAAYALVWEFGRVDINPGPKTQWGTNPDGETVVLTKTAPYGYIRVNRAKYRQFVREEFYKQSWKGIKPNQIPKVVQALLARAADKCAELIAQTAPEDTGELKSEIRAVELTGPVNQETTDRLSIRPRVRR